MCGCWRCAGHGPPLSSTNDAAPPRSAGTNVASMLKRHSCFWVFKGYFYHWWRLRYTQCDSLLCLYCHLDLLCRFEVCFHWDALWRDWGHFHNSHSWKMRASWAETLKISLKKYVSTNCWRLRVIDLPITNPLPPSLPSHTQRQNNIWTQHTHQQTEQSHDTCRRLAGRDKCRQLNYGLLNMKQLLPTWLTPQSS